MPTESRKKKSKSLTVQQMAEIALKDLLPKQEQRTEKDPRSTKLRNLLKRVPVIPLQKLQKWKDQVFDLGRKEGFDDMLIGKWVRKAMSEADYSERWIREMLPDTAKQTQERVRDRDNNNVTNDVKAELSSTYPESVTDTVIQSQPEEQEQEDEAPTGYYQMPVEQFNIRDIEQYDRLFLIRVVQFLYQWYPKEKQTQ